MVVYPLGESSPGLITLLVSACITLCKSQPKKARPHRPLTLGDSVTQSIRMRFSVHTPLTFLDQQPFGYCPRAKRPRSNTRAGVVGYFFETAHHAIAPMWQPGPYIRSSELCSIVEGAHGNVARKTKWWLEHEIPHARGNS
jgi:hypothetical protein